MKRTQQAGYDDKYSFKYDQNTRQNVRQPQPKFTTYEQTKEFADKEAVGRLKFKILEMGGKRVKNEVQNPTQLPTLVVNMETALHTKMEGWKG
jgi:hypothetical protein